MMVGLVTKVGVVLSTTSGGLLLEGKSAAVCEGLRLDAPTVDRLGELNERSSGGLTPYSKKELFILAIHSEHLI